MSKKDIDYTLRPIKFLDDPYYFLGKARQIKKQKKQFYKDKENIIDEIERLRLYKRRQDADKNEINKINKKLSKLIEKRNMSFEDAYQKAVENDYLKMRCLQIEKNVETFKKVMIFPFKLLKIMFNIMFTIQKPQTQEVSKEVSKETKTVVQELCEETTPKEIEDRFNEAIRSSRIRFK